MINFSSSSFTPLRAVHSTSSSLSSNFSRIMHEIDDNLFYVSEYTIIGTGSFVVKPQYKLEIEKGKSYFNIKFDSWSMK